MKRMSGMKIYAVEDTWLAFQMDRPVFRIGFEPELPDDHANDIDRSLSCLASRVFAYSKTDANNVTAISMIEDMGFHLVETHMQFEKTIDLSSDRMDFPEIRFAQREDMKAVSSLAGRSFICSRFHMDPLIPNPLADRIKAEWAANYFRGKRGDQMVVGVFDGRIVGFLQLLRTPEQTLIIDLIAVDKRFRGRGLAKKMCRYAETNTEGMALYRVGTQVTNLSSIRLYQRLGFSFTGASYTFHFHRE